jgi:hypothetical protein
MASSILCKFFGEKQNTKLNVKSFVRTKQTLKRKTSQYKNVEKIY